MRTLEFVILCTSFAEACFPGPLEVSTDEVPDANRSDSVIADDGETTQNLCQAEVVCAPPSTCHEAGICDPATGQCTYAESIPGTPCDDGVRCTNGESCLNGGICQSTRVPDDTINDFARIITGPHDAVISSLSVTADEIAVLIAIDTLAAGGSVSLGSHSSGEPAAVPIPPDTHALVLARYTLGGLVIAAETVAETTTGTLSPGTVDRMPDGSYRIGGHFSGEISVLTKLGRRSLHTDQTLAAFSFGIGSAIAYVSDGGSSAELVRLGRIAVAGEDCVAVSPVQGAATGEIRTSDGTVRASFASPESVVGSIHMLWAPGCNEFLTARREIRPTTSAGAYVPIQIGSAPDHLAILGLGSTSFEVRTGDDIVANAVIPDGATQAAILSFDTLFADPRLIIARPLFEDELWTVPYVWGLAVETTGLAVGIGAFTDAVFEFQSGEVVPFADNPGTGSFALRSIVARFDREDEIQWMGVEAGDPKENWPFRTLALRPEGVLAVGPITEGTFGSAPQISMSGGLYAGAYDAARRVWGLELLRGEDAVVTAVALRPVPNSSAVIVAGTIRGDAIVGSSRTGTITGPDAQGFLVRINSDDGIGCNR